MASFVAGIGGSSGYQLIMDVNQIGQNTGANTSTVSIHVYIHQTAGSGVWGSGSWSANVDGEGYGGGFGYDYRSSDDVTVLNTTKVIGHNADGTRSLSFSASVDMANGPYATTGSGSGGLTLSTIARYATVTGFSANSITDTTFNIAITADVTCDYFTWWTTQAPHIDGGAHHDTIVNSTSKTFSITAPTSDTSYTLRCAVRRDDSDLWTENGNITVTTEKQNKFFRPL